MYCKYSFITKIKFWQLVLIVAKCIVNSKQEKRKIKKNLVLIVAKCIVNGEKPFLGAFLGEY